MEMSSHSGVCPTAHRNAREHKNAASHMHQVINPGHRGHEQNSTPVVDRETSTLLGSKPSRHAMDRTLDGQSEADNNNGGDNINRLATMASSSSSSSSFSGSSGACFAHGTSVTLNTGATKAIQDLRAGDIVQTLAGERFVIGLLRTRVESEVLCRLGDVFVTAWHPVSLHGIDWHFPVHVTVEPIVYTGDVYSVLLEADNSPFAHTVHVGASLWGATLGHGITSMAVTDDGTTLVDVRGHPFFGDYDKVCEKIAVLRPVNCAYQYYGVLRDQATGLVNGFRAAVISIGGASAIQQSFNSAL